MFTRHRKIEVMDEMKKFFEAMKDKLKKDIASGQQEMRADQDEMKESHNTMKEEMKEACKITIATGQEE